MTTTIGQRLKEAREEKRLTLDKVFEATRIRVQYLQALEEDDLSVMPSPVQARGYLRNYAEFLGLDVDKTLEELREANAQKPADVVIGPAEIPDVQQAPLPEPAIASVALTVEEPAPLLKPKPARRKKADSQLTSDAAATPQRRGRKKAEPGPELTAQPVTQNEPFDIPSSGSPGQNGDDDQPSLTQQKDESLPSQQDTPSDGHETVQESDVVVPGEGSEANQESGIQAPVEPPQTVETQLESDVSDNLWQAWLNRLGSTLAARNKRRTLVPKESAAPEIASSVVNAATEGAGVPLENSTQIFIEIGRELHERRELLSLHLEEVERNTHVKAHYLDALERGAMDDLPSTVQTRGMLANYATFLDLDVDALLLRFADALQARYRERNPQKPARKPGQPILANLPPMRSFIAGDMIFGIGIVILLVGFAIWGVSRVLTLQSEQEVEPTAPSISEILLASPDAIPVTATPTLIPIDAFPGEATVTVVIPTLNANVNVQVNLVVAERTYMRVIVDGEVVFEGRVLPGTAYPFEAVDQVEVLVGNGAAIRIVYNGRDLGLLGSYGQVVSNIYLANEVITPTGMPTATETVTPTPTNTVPPTATSRFTSTPVTATPAPSATALP
ncbi:MAG TPA: RodZ domain-containing protein [Anaerolineales bacterium]|nr:RodZ domain-containing protein [Anaerolineales bacterium]